MQLDHERLDVYQVALDFLVFANGIIEALPRGRSHLADQFTQGVDVDPAEPRRGRWQALETRQAPVLPHGERLGD